MLPQAARRAPVRGTATGREPGHLDGADAHRAHGALTGGEPGREGRLEDRDAEGAGLDRRAGG